MKPGFLALLVTCSLNAFAGNAKQDPNIAKIRADFEAATPTTVGEIKTNQPYDCYLFQAWKNAYKIFPIKTTFRSLNGLLLVSFDWGPKYSLDISAVEIKEDKISAKSMPADEGASRDDLSFRSANGLLFIEQSATPARASEDKSISIAKGSTQNFQVCSVPQ